MPRLRRGLKERFWQKVIIGGDDECWQWTASKVRGYGSIGDGAGKVVLAHRVSWSFENGPIPNGACICHSCDTPSCVNPKHLFLGSHADNMKDMAVKLRGNTGRRKLSDSDILKAHDLKKTGLSNTEIAAQFGVTQPAICKALRGYTPRYAALRKAHLSKDVSKTACAECMQC